jgi:hypothetical protein
MADSSPTGTILVDPANAERARAVADRAEGAGSERTVGAQALSLNIAGGRSSASERAAAAVHVLSLVGAFSFWSWSDRGLWFFGDEWDFLMDRGLKYAPANHGSIWFPHNEHWSTLPILLWRGLFSVFHLSSYWPYIVPVLLAQVGIMHLVWRLCRRADIDVWVATGAVVLLGFLGAGAEDLTWAFQIGFVGSVLFGLVAIDLLDRPPRAGALEGLRDAGTSVALVASLMCSTVGDAMVFGAAVLALARLPHRRALKVFALPAGAYVTWFALVGHLGLAGDSHHLGTSTYTSAPGYVWTGLSSALGQALNLQSAGTAVLVGLGAWVAWHMRRLWARQPAVLGLCASAVAFYVLAAIGRDTSQPPTASRYMYVAMALLLPLVATVLGSACTCTAARAGALALIGFITLGNVGQALTWVSVRTALTSATKDEVVGTSYLVAAGVQDISGPAASPVPLNPNLTVADIAGLERARLLPRPSLGQPAIVDARARLALGVWNGLAMTLTHRPLETGRFAFVRVSAGSASAPDHGCTTFSALAVSPPMQIWLQVPPAEGPASLEVETSPAPPGTVHYLGALLAPPRSPTSMAVELTVPANGSGYLNDNDAGTDVVVIWPEGAALTLCGLSRSAVTPPERRR